MGVSTNGGVQNGWFIIENLIEMDDLGLPLFQETLKWEFQDPYHIFGRILLGYSRSSKKYRVGTSNLSRVLSHGH